MRWICLTLLLIGAALSQPALAQVDDERRLLVPICITEPIPGAFGSLWEGTFSIYNPTSTVAGIDPCGWPEGDGCLLFLDPRTQVQPGATMLGFPDRYLRNAVPLNGGGCIVQMTTHTNTAALAFQLRVRDTSRNHLSAGTEIPVVRHSELRRGPIYLLDVPFDDRFRRTLRLYHVELSLTNSVDFLVRVVDPETNRVLSERNVRAERHVPGNLFHPNYAQLDLVKDGFGAVDRGRVEVIPLGLSPNAGVWAFVSVTNNVTQEFTVITPQ